MNFLKRYANWLHLQWPAGKVEKLPLAGEDGETNVEGIRVVGDLTGIPLLKFSADTGAKAVRAFLEESRFEPSRDPEDKILDVAIIGGGVSGIAAAREARQKKLHFAVFESKESFSTIRNFPKGKPIFTYPTDMEPTGGMHFRSEVKEDLVEELEAQQQDAQIEPVSAKIESITRQGDHLFLNKDEGEPVVARAVVVAIGRSGNHRKLEIPGEEKDKVFNRLHDPKEFTGQKVLIVGGGDSAAEAAIALVEAGVEVTLSYRKAELTRPKPENVEKIKSLSSSSDEKLALKLETEPTAIHDDAVVLRSRQSDQEETIENDVVFALIGREPPLEFFRRSKLKVLGDRSLSFWLGMGAFVLFCFWLYHWKGGKPVPFYGYLPNWLSPNPGALSNWLQNLSGTIGSWFRDPATLLGTVSRSASTPSFYYTLAYSAVVVIFGIRRIRYRKTPYITVQTYTLMAVQVLPLFILPEIILPWLGHNGAYDSGLGKWFADTFFPSVNYDPNGREYWRAYGFILAWPLMAWNWFTAQPLWGWLIVGSIQTFVILPLIIRRWGKGAYCGWICSCGALAETLGDRHRHKMPHGPKWNRLNLLGQGILAFAILLMIVRIVGWIAGPDSLASWIFTEGASKLPLLNYGWFVDLFLAGVLGYGLYFWFSGRMWCRFACPLAALMHIYARFSRFRIFAEKKKCISCNVCTSVCHQGIDIMNFANKGLPMEDPECVRCSACVQSCPTGVLSFGRYDKEMRPVYDLLNASPVQKNENDKS
ncbi:NAD(P)-binding domain-containing protein [Puniceicoccus vermicola]|uniref:NAD(P)-binding domain-containing protein n=1 Tax=Puniceicoccus vermicola TaxID=388746 RepID=A0A7X1E7D0_9BACT|nr:NAD(P)-binding domain-containing protein [Puniceicoccus vermicola]MBC2603592.1 NAD(P)-binding domain-containing protein [Puniceicoccus vermicola]